MSILSFNRVRLRARADNMPHKLFSGQGAGVSAGLMAVSTALIGVFIAAAGINVKIVVDGTTGPRIELPPVLNGKVSLKSIQPSRFIIP